ncbi:restriction endonuclease subunit S [Bacillus halotolerans]|uniref:restriction endonuclease subunit S n=1 Tax=Bacillus halotolerans TaxID=260554 RepID=UPI002DBC4021|nr:restriction endonuclease subunit S [Bacillus halotolerans]MEC3638713.1 restriction endonuclease subunit S [Bacillus halotolerans]
MQFSKYQNTKSLLNLSNQWSLKKFDELLKDVTRTGTKIPSSDYEETGLYAVIDQGKGLIAGYSNLENPIQGEKIIFGDHTRVLKYIESDSFHIGADGVKVLENKVPEKVLTKYIFYYLSSVNIPNTGYNRHFKYLKEIVIPVPGIEIQLKLVEVFDSVKNLIIKRESQIEALDELTQSIFSKMFENNHLVEKPLNEYVNKIISGKSLAGNVPSQYKVINTSAVSYKEFLPDKSKYLPEDYVPPENHLINKGDLLVSRMNTSELVGAAAYVFEQVEKLTIPDRIWKLEMDNSKLNPVYAWYFINQKRFRDSVTGISTGTSGSMKNIAQQKYLQLLIKVPPIELQNEFENKLILIRNNKKRLLQSKKVLNNLYTSVLQKAFKGELFQEI